jgi:hypothetical protein
MGWAYDNLSETRRREIAHDLIIEGGGKISSQPEGSLIGLCPLHGEKNPSFAYSYAQDVYNCSSGCGAGDLVKLFGEIRGFGNKEAIKEFRKAYDPEYVENGQPGKRRSRRSAKPEPATKPMPEPEPEPDRVIPESELEAMPDLPEVWIGRLIESRGWTQEVIERMGLKLWVPQDGDMKKARIAIPIRNAKGELVNIRLYRPKAKDNKVLSWFMWIDGEKQSFGKPSRLWPLGE